MKAQNAMERAENELQMEEVKNIRIILTLRNKNLQYIQKTLEHQYHEEVKYVIN
jgi:hypothetical protein